MKRMIYAVALIVAGFAGNAGSSRAEQLAFEAVSIKPSQPGSAGYGEDIIAIRRGGQLNGRSISVRQLVLIAFRKHDYSIVGAPKWIADERFDIDAKANADLAGPFLVAPTGSPTTLELVLRSLLIDRFKLMTHTETRTAPVYDLVFARGDHRLGPGMQRTTGDCANAVGPGARQPVGNGLRPTCGIEARPGAFLAGGATLEQLAENLSWGTDRSVVDQTGERARFDIVLKWTPDLPAQPGTPAPALDPDRPGLFTAIQEQLGLKLEPSRGPVDILVIDHIERPTTD